ncbi:MAG: hypothetical protein Q7R59_02375 [bacterium]|nr:hypothetical protein [bacterium]
MLITITVVSILTVSAVVWLLNKILPFTVCPICAGVLLTWVGLVGAHFAGYEVSLVVPALLMGGSVVGVTYQLEKKLDKPSLLWKVLFIPAGFIAAYALLEQLWIVFFLAIGFLLLTSLAFLSSHSEASRDTEKKMEDCC